MFESPAGHAAYRKGYNLNANPYRVGTRYARTWTDGWLSAWMASLQPWPAPLDEELERFLIEKQPAMIYRPATPA